MSKSSVASIETAARVLQFLLENSHQGQTFSSILKGVGLPKSTAFNVLQTLRDLSFVSLDSTTRCYTLGWRLVELGYAAADRQGYLEVVRPHLKAFSVATGLTCLVQRRVDDRQVIVERIDPQTDFVIVAPASKSYPLCFGAPGKVFLAYLDESELDSHLSPDKLRAYAPRTTTEPASYKSQLPKVRELGWASSCEEGAPGLSSVAAPVFNFRGDVVVVVSAVGLSSVLTTNRIEFYGLELKKIADKITADIKSFPKPGVDT